MLKSKILKVIKSTSEDFDLTREQKFQVFLNVCDNMLKEGRISKAQHQSWTNIF